KDLIDIGGNNMGLSRKVNRFTHNIILPIMNGVDDSGSLVVQRLHIKTHNITNSNRIGAFDVLDSELSFYAAIIKCTEFCFYGVPTSCGLINGSCHASNLVNKITIFKSIEDISKI